MAKKTTQAVHVRMPKELHRKLQREADKRAQTMNAEILTRLHNSFDPDYTLSGIEGQLDSMEYSFSERLSEIKERLAEVMASVRPDKEKKP